MSDRMILHSALFGGICLATLLVADGQAQQWTVSMRAMQNPLPLGQCTAIEVVVKDAHGAIPIRPNGKQVDWQDFDLSLTTTAPDAFTWSNEAHRFLCAKAPTASSALVVAYYPARHLTPGEVVPGITAQQTIEVALQGAGQPASAASAPGQPYVPPTVAAASPQTAAPSTSGQPTTPTGANPAQTYAAPAGPSAPTSSAAVPAPTASAAAPPTSGQPTPSAASPTQVSTASAGLSAPASSGAAPAPTAPAAAPAPGPSVASAAPAQTENKEKGVGGFFKKFGKHLKEKAGEVTNQTAENLASSATQVVDATAQNGSNLVSGAAAHITSAAQTTVGGISTSLVPSGLRGGGGSDNLALAVSSGDAELRTMRFVGNTPELDATGLQLAKRLAAVLKATPGSFEIQVHVDPLPSPAKPGDTQTLSESRAGTVKDELVQNGVDAFRLCALGYGTSEPKPEVPPEGGPASSARVVVRKMQQKVALSPGTDPCLNR